MADTRITDAEIAGYMGWRGPGAYTEASLRKIRQIIDHVLRAERATPPSPSTAPDATHPAFQAAMKAAGHRFDRWDNGTYKGMTEYRWEGWVAALASRPAEVGDEGLPPLPPGAYA